MRVNRGGQVVTFTFLQSIQPQPGLPYLSLVDPSECLKSLWGTVLMWL